MWIVVEYADYRIDLETGGAEASVLQWELLYLPLLLGWYTI